MLNQLAVINYRLDNPRQTLQQMSREFNVSREWIRQILKAHHRPTRHISQAQLDRICPVCGGVKEEGSRICMKCWNKSTHRDYTCADCGKKFKRLISAAKRNKHHFCNNKCQGHWLGINFGKKHRKKGESNV